MRTSTVLISGASIALDDSEDGVTVSFANGPVRTFDLVVIAEGLRSRTRSMVFAGDVVRGLGFYVAYLTIPRTDDDTDLWRWQRHEHEPRRGCAGQKHRARDVPASNRVEYQVRCVEVRCRGSRRSTGNELPLFARFAIPLPKCRGARPEPT